MEELALGEALVVKLQLEAAQRARELRSLADSSSSAKMARARKGLAKARSRLERDAHEARAMVEALGSLARSMDRARASLDDALRIWADGWQHDYAQLEENMLDVDDSIGVALEAAQQNVDELLSDEADAARRLADELEDVALEGEVLKDHVASHGMTSAFMDEFHDYEQVVQGQVATAQPRMSQLEARLAQARSPAAFRVGPQLAALRSLMTSLREETRNARRVAAYLRKGAGPGAAIMSKLVGRTRRAKASLDAERRERQDARRRMQSRLSSRDTVSKREYEALEKQYFALEEVLDRERKATRVCDRCRTWEDKVRELRFELAKVKRKQRDSETLERYSSMPFNATTSRGSFGSSVGRLARSSSVVGSPRSGSVCSSAPQSPSSPKFPRHLRGSMSGSGTIPEVVTSGASSSDSSSSGTTSSSGTYMYVYEDEVELYINGANAGGGADAGASDRHALGGSAAPAGGSGMRRSRERRPKPGRGKSVRYGGVEVKEISPEPGDEDKPRSLTAVTNHGASAVRAIALSEVAIDDGRPLASASADGSIKVTMLNANGRAREWLDVSRADASSDGSVAVLEFHPKGMLLAAAGRERTGSKQVGLARIFNWGAGRVLKSIQTTAPVTALRFARDGKQLVLGMRGTVEIYDVRTASLVRKIAIGAQSGVRETVTHMAFGVEDHLLLVGGSFGKVRVYDLRSSEQLTCFQEHVAPLVAIFAPPLPAKGSSHFTVHSLDKRESVLSVDALGVARVWDTVTNSSITEWNVGSGVMAVALAMEEAVLAVAHSDGSLAVLNLTANSLGYSSESLPATQVSADALTSIAYGPNMGILAVGCSDGKVLVGPIPAKE
ncbi:uncharacterized protein AMSG_09910 [Thecamonas trahens ATCC 50062]|uniref:Uncharacterized protein n=1 Tax=Thecamonas trahens ATCC 50062 TaxID=461836 RepID=A0A0L0DPA5_THETB|nr:hypothetical protein AMSG_09910 [Thecamonas trahens ATCC 50062]KNC54132.1 hypothetical protein AMSG_09910 [Thecamonas trahens ATCC 50062]|eukprot:XP_013753954.1 hypothetical protein AMSG_09910 [Thecamonas trahens ATCC 50062]